MKKNVTEKCLICKEVADRYMLANEKEYGVRWGMFCYRCAPIDPRTIKEEGNE